ncbi:MAG TPA: carboxypeptidase regulatory-like domain-containing protein [Pyrinomonadaceae bacterium]
MSTSTSSNIAALVFALLFALVFALSPTARAQESPAAASQADPTPTPAATDGPAAKATKGVAGSITGRVLGDGGEPVAGARVFAITSSTSRGPGEPTATTDASGSFKLDNLAPGLYTINAVLRGHVPDPNEYPSGGPRTLHRPGDSVTIRLVKGGVVTGTVTDAGGEPLVAMSVRAFMVRDLEGDTSTAGYSLGEDQTDDRGVYRIYGLRQGVYVVVAGVATGRPSRGPASVTPFEYDAPTFYPSGTRDTATEVTVRAGQDTAGIDIRHRGERGRRITGTVTAAQTGSRFETGAIVVLTHAATGTQLSFTPVQPGEGERSFSFEAVADGEYEVQARLGDGGQFLGASDSRRVVVSGADATGVRLALAPLASLDGSLVVELAGEAARAQAECKGRGANMLPQEAVVTALSEDLSKRNQGARRATLRRETVPDSSGSFTLRGLEAGRYRLDLRLADDNWYVREVQMPAAAPPPQRTPTAATPARPGAANNQNAAGQNAPTAATAPRETVELKSGQQLAGLTVRVAEGAASLAGRVVPHEENAPLPPLSQLRVHLVPAAREHADNTLRHYETTLAPDGAFAFRNLAPGRYLLLARPADAAAPDTPPRPAAWDAAARARLRRDAEAADLPVELEPCRRTTDFAHRFRQTAGK